LFCFLLPCSLVVVGELEPCLDDFGPLALGEKIEPRVGLVKEVDRARFKIGQSKANPALTGTSPKAFRTQILVSVCKL
jgi:hypothetical protein